MLNPQSNRTVAWETRYARRVTGVASSAIRELLKVVQTPGMISLAGGMPPPEIFPIQAMQAACQHVLAKRGREAMQYGTTEGYTPLRQFAVEWMGRFGLRLDESNVLITSGGLQGLDLAARLLINPGDPIVVESPTFLGALQSFTISQAQFLSVPIDDEQGICPERLEAALRQRPALIYLIPTFQNPTGVTLSAQRRREIIELADRYQVPIVEDDPYSHLRFEGEEVSPLVRLDADLRGGTGKGLQGNVIYVGSFSKMLGPGLRVGWLVGPAEVIRRLTLLKQGTDVHAGVLAQMIVHQVTQDDFMVGHTERLRAALRVRRDAMLGALERHFPPGVQWTRPEGGLFLWVTLPPTIDAADLLAEALEHQVAFVPGQSFYADGSGQHTLRLNYSYPTPEQIETAIERLGKILAWRLK
jgi:2-aminoadipate transaminase